MIAFKFLAAGARAPFTGYRWPAPGAWVSAPAGYEPDSAMVDDNAFAVYADRAGQIWIGTYSKGLQRLDPNTGVFGAPILFGKKSESQIRVITQLSDGAMKRVDLSFTPPPVHIDGGPCCKPYGAPPARRRLV